jgi:arylsulfatase A-like enzyme
METAPSAPSMKTLLLLLLCLATPFAASAESRAKPNLIVILVDDMGYSDIGCYGGEIATPNLDRLARGGMRFTQFYNNAACTPTRASLLTGLDAARAGQAANMVDPDDPFWKLIDSPAYHGVKIWNTVTLPQLLRAQGYQTYMTGKWHQGERDGMRPTHRGFDRYYGVLWGAVGNQFKIGGDDFRADDTRVTQAPDDFYTTDAFTDRAIGFIEEGDPKRPYFLYLAYTAPHLPWNAKPKDIAKYQGIYHKNWQEIRAKRFARQKDLGIVPKDAELPPWTPLAADPAKARFQDQWDDHMTRYAAMIDSIDQGVGRLLDTLERRGELDNTLILFLSDNGMWAVDAGGGAPWAEASNTPFRYFKGYLHQGGIASPLIAHWPGVIPANTIQRKQYAHVKDIAPTFLEILGVDPPTSHQGRDVLPMDGHSFLRALRDPDAAQNHPLFQEYAGNEALRDGRWKLVRAYHDDRLGSGGRTDPRTGKWELYDLETDPFEAHDLADQSPERVREMAARHAEWARGAGVVPYEDVAVKLKRFLEEKAASMPSPAKQEGPRGGDSPTKPLHP